MTRASLCLILGLSAVGAAAGPVTLQLSSALSWPGSLTLRGGLMSQDFRLAAACQAPASLSPAQPGPRELLAGVSLPWLRLGPLSPAGVLREAANPLGFEAGSDVFVQRTGFLLDLAIPARQAGALFMPIPRTFGVFYEPDGGGGQRLGCLASIGSQDGVSIEAFASLAEPPARDMGEEWLEDTAPFPGGRILVTAGRIRLGSPSLGITATLGASAGERCPPGRFIHLHCAVRTAGAGFYLLYAGADRAYLTPSGGHCLDESLISTAFVLSGSSGSADVRLSRSVRQLPFSPGPDRGHQDEASISIQRVLVSSKALLLSGRIDGSTTICTDVDGTPQEGTRRSAALVARISPFRVEASVSRGAPGAFSARLSSEASLDRQGSSTGMTGTLERLDDGPSVLSAGTFLRLKRKDFTLSLEAEIEKLRLDGIRFSVLWAVRDVRE